MYSLKGQLSSFKIWRLDFAPRKCLSPLAHSVSEVLLLTPMVPPWHLTQMISTFHHLLLLAPFELVWGLLSKRIRALVGFYECQAPLVVSRDRLSAYVSLQGRQDYVVNSHDKLNLFDSAGPSGLPYTTLSQSSSWVMLSDVRLWAILLNAWRQIVSNILKDIQFYDVRSPEKRT